jgi:hypothetical protein
VHCSVGIFLLLVSYHFFDVVQFLWWSFSAPDLSNTLPFHSYSLIIVLKNIFYYLYQSMVYIGYLFATVFSICLLSKDADGSSPGLLFFKYVRCLCIYCLYLFFILRTLPLGVITLFCLLAGLTLSEHSLYS